MFNLLGDPFFPTVTRKGARRWLSFAELADDSPDAPVDFDWPRADFNMAAYEFAIGVATLALRPTRETDWLRLWRAEADPDELREKLAPLLHAFELDGDGPRFMQEFGGLERTDNSKIWPIEWILIDSAAENTEAKNSDVLTRRRRYGALGAPAAAMALYALQQFAPSGGSGNRTSMRRGGPMTTLVAPGAPHGERPSLWRIILANLVVREQNDFDNDDLPKILSWLAPTLVSDKAHGERVIHELDGDTHPLHCFFGMPRRISLRISGAGLCPMTGVEAPLAHDFVQKPWGANYGLWAHPLTPYRRQKEGDTPYSTRPKSARFGYSDWISVTVGTKEGLLAQPAANVGAARRGGRRELLSGAGTSDASLRIGGWVTKNATAIAYLSAEQPLHLASSDEAQIALDTTAIAFARAADEAANALVAALRAALFSEGAKPATDRAVFEDARATFYELTENDFHEALDATLSDGAPNNDAPARAWLAIVSRAVAAAFDGCAPVPIDAPERAQRIAAAYRQLRFALAGYGPQGKRLFEALGLAPPESSKTAKKGGRHGR